MRNKHTLLGSGYKIAAVVIPLFIAAFFLGWSHPVLFRFPVVSKAILFGTGAGCMIVGLVVYISSAVLIVKAFRSGRLVTAGPFAFSRNPMYASFVLFLVPGASFMLNNWLLCAVIPVMYATVSRFCSEEEQHLVELFGRAWREYAKRTGKIVPRLW